MKLHRSDWTFFCFGPADLPLPVLALCCRSLEIIRPLVCEKIDLEAEFWSKLIKVQLKVRSIRFLSPYRRGGPDQPWLILLTQKSHNSNNSFSAEISAFLFLSKNFVAEILIIFDGCQSDWYQVRTQTEFSSRVVLWPENPRTALHIPATLLLKVETKSQKSRPNIRLGLNVMLDLRVWFLIRRARKGQTFQRLHALFSGLFYSETGTWLPVAMQSAALHCSSEISSSEAPMPRPLPPQDQRGGVDHLPKSCSPRAQAAADPTGRGSGVNSGGGTEPWLSWNQGPIFKENEDSWSDRTSPWATRPRGAGGLVKGHVY